jgi:hypothetical protein
MRRAPQQTVKLATRRRDDMTITLPPQLEAALAVEARRRGVAPEALAVELLRQRLPAPAPADAEKDSWVQRLRQVATDCGVALSDEAVSREGIYE